MDVLRREAGEELVVHGAADAATTEAVAHEHAALDRSLVGGLLRETTAARPTHDFVTVDSDERAMTALVGMQREPLGAPE